MPIPQASDLINLDHVNGGDASAGNGGNGYNHGDISYNAVLTAANAQSVSGAETHLHNADHVWQGADWDAGGGGNGGFAQAKEGFLAYISNTGSGGPGGAATSNGSQNNASGGDTANVHADTTGYQVNDVLANQSGTILAGMGGNGGNGNYAVGGAVTPTTIHIPTDTHNDLTSVTNTLSNFDLDHGHIDLSHIGS